MSFSRSKTALSDIRVLDMSRVLAGPWCAQILADLGADVIKIERPKTGDDSRAFPPFFGGDENAAGMQSSYFLSANRGKRSIEIDLSSSEGQRKVRALAQTADVLIENYKVGTLKRYNLDSESLLAINSRLIYCSITGFGQTGPYAKQAAYDTAIQAMGGIMSVTGVPDDEPSGGPQKVGVPITDVLTGVYAATGILAALHERTLSGRGQHVDLALLDVCVASLSNVALKYFIGGQVPVRTGNAHINSAPSDIYRCKDGGLLMMNIGNDRQFLAFCREAEIQDMSADSRFESNPLRLKNRAALESRVHAAFATRDLAAWLKKLTDAGISVAPINSFDKVFDDPQVQARQMLVHLAHDRYGTSPSIGNPIRLSRTPVSYTAPAPLLGEHNEEVDREIHWATRRAADKPA
jgi:crotonobetainyl-CoA:carnitine CoA-transferase CaiB-like acyl-CoA transferase